jgi:hypothetical protein
MDGQEGLDQRRELEQRLLQMSAQHSVHIIIGLHPAYTTRQAAWEHVATGALVSFKGRACVVTDAHIIRVFQEKWDEDPRVILQIGDAVLHLLDVKQRMHSISDSSDLAVLDVSGIERDVCVSSPKVKGPTFYDAGAAWPPPEVCNGDVLFFGEYRDRGRSTKDHIRHLLLLYCNLSVVVTDAFPDRFKCKLDRTGWVDVLNPDDQSGVLEDDFSGLSGAPIFRLWTAAQRAEYEGQDFPIEMFPNADRPAELVGFMMEHSSLLQDMLVGSASSNLRSDGTLWGNTKR